MKPRNIFLLSQAALLLLLTPAAAAFAAEYSLQVEPGVVVPLSAPQSTIYNVGAGLALKPLIEVTPYLDAGPAFSYSYMPAAIKGETPGVAVGIGGGLRLKAPHNRESYSGIAPWLDADALYVRTGKLNRVGFDAGLGLAIPFGEARTYWAGPFVRYFQTIQRERAGYDTRDAKLITAGINLEIGRAK